MKLKLVEEYRILEEARKQLMSAPGTTCQIEITENAVYINNLFY